MNDYVSPDWAKAALLTIDIQRDFTLPGAPLEIPGTMEVLPRIQPLLQAFRNQQKPIIHVVRLYLPDGSNADLCRRKDIKQGKRMVVPGSDGAELMAELKPSPEVKLDAEKLLAGKLQLISPQEWLMYKPRWGAFFQTPLESHLHNLAINTIVVCGCNFPNCPRTTIYEASERDFRIVLVTDAISQIYAQGLQELKNIGVSLLNSTECLAKTGARA
ncbi:MAG: cysteine hydrolase [Dehalococcoidia bacterium]|nr:cysteine hydrolase [Dehalococcoidia bacterium]